MLWNSSVLIFLSRIKNSDIGIIEIKRSIVMTKFRVCYRKKNIYSKTSKQKHLYYLVSFLLLDVLFKVRSGAFWGSGGCLIQTIELRVLFWFRSQFICFFQDRIILESGVLTEKPGDHYHISFLDSGHWNFEVSLHFHWQCVVKF